MNALSIDCAVSKISIAAKKDGLMAKITLNVGIKQSEKLLPSIDLVLNELGLTPADLDYTAITLGPGTFTGLRLGLSALKAINLSHNVPLYGVPSLKVYAWPYRNAKESVISIIESKEDEYFYSFYSKGKELSTPEPDCLDAILKKISQEDTVLACGPGSKYFAERVAETTPLYSVHCYSPENDCTESLFEIAEEMIANKETPVQDYDGPLYFKKSEAELVLEQKQANNQ